MAGKEVLTLAKRFVEFVNRSPSPFHAVEEVKARLRGAGFTELSETAHWNLKPLDKCFVVKNQSTIVAFAVGGKYQPGNGFTMIGAHTDSPCLKLKPTSKQTRQGYLQCAVQTYGGGIWLTWFDRDLKLAGRVIVKRGDKLESLLVHIDKPLLRIPNIAIHLHREINEQFNLNKQSHLLPILGTTYALEQQEKTKGDGEAGKAASNNGWNQADKHHELLLRAVCNELGVKAEDIVDMELCLADTQPATIGGAMDEFVFAPRLDNLLNSFAACEALVNSVQHAAFASDPNVRYVALFDNEEVGSESAQGAASLFVESSLRRICYAFDGAATGNANACLFEEAIARSMLISADQAHAVHPNYSDKHDELNRPELHRGIVMKVNANQRYATSGVTAAVIRRCAEHAGVALQDFAVRNDMMCGSTIGPILAARLGVATCDVGAPQLSMHSIRETCCTSGVSHAVRLFEAFFERYPTLFESSRVV